MNDHDYRALIEQSHQLNELTQHVGWEVLVDYLQAVCMEPHQRQLLNGRINSVEEYKKVAGELVGMQRAIDAPLRVAQMLDAERERRDEAGEPTT